MKLTKTDCSISDRMEITSRTITPQGFLVAPAVIARTGVQRYRASELGTLAKDAGIPGDTIIRLYRPAEEVFAPEGIQSFDGVPVALNHPPGNVIDAKNWRDRAVGDMDDISKASETTLGGKITVRDAKAVEAVQSGKKYLSAGYRFSLDPTPGVTADGQEYDAVQRSIRGNHVAIVDSPRGGPVCHISDSTSGGKAMRTIVIDGITFNTEDSAFADAVTKLVSDRDGLAVKNKAKVKVGDHDFSLKEPAPLQLAIDGLEKEVKELKSKQVSDADIEKKVSARVKVVGDALKLVPDFKHDGKTDVQIQREVIAGVIAKDEASKAMVTAALDGQTIEAADAGLLSTAFRILASKPAAARSTTTTTSALSKALTANDGNGADDKPVGREAWMDKMNNAWNTNATKQ